MNTYDGVMHSHVTHEGLRGPRVILLATSTRIWIDATYGDAIEGAVVVTDGLPIWPYSETGDCILSIPRDACSFWSNEEAAQIIARIDADDFLLACAR
jgi:hypothetical protein